jgi:hypothetical protein
MSDKKTPSDKAEAGPLQKLVDSGIQVRCAQFIQAVKNGDGIPESGFNLDSNSPSRHVKMWMCADGALLVCWHKGRWFATPMSNVVDVGFL